MKVYIFWFHIWKDVHFSAWLIRLDISPLKYKLYIKEFNFNILSTRSHFSNYEKFLLLLSSGDILGREMN